MIIQKQTWASHTRFLIAAEQGSIMLDTFPEKQSFGGTAFIWGLWVEPSCRREGMAKHLLDRAEWIAKSEGHDAVYLDWELADTPREILQWYFRRGYEEVEFGPESAMIKKILL